MESESEGRDEGNMELHVNGGIGYQAKYLNLDFSKGALIYLKESVDKGSKEVPDLRLQRLLSRAFLCLRNANDGALDAKRQFGLNEKLMPIWVKHEFRDLRTESDVLKTAICHLLENEPAIMHKRSIECLVVEIKESLERLKMVSRNLAYGCSPDLPFFRSKHDEDSGDGGTHSRFHRNLGSTSGIHSQDTNSTGSFEKGSNNSNDNQRQQQSIDGIASAHIRKTNHTHFDILIHTNARHT